MENNNPYMSGYQALDKSRKSKEDSYMASLERKLASRLMDIVDML